MDSFNEINVGDVVKISNGDYITWHARGKELKVFSKVYKNGRCSHIVMLHPDARAKLDKHWCDKYKICYKHIGKNYFIFGKPSSIEKVVSERCKRKL